MSPRTPGLCKHRWGPWSQGKVDSPAGDLSTCIGEFRFCLHWCGVYERRTELVPFVYKRSKRRKRR